MMQRPQSSLLPDGKRLHLHHGPIDLIVEAWGPGRIAAYARATHRFRTMLEELVEELGLLRSALHGPPNAPPPSFNGATARRMHAATLPFADRFITPMAAVAGAVADEILVHITTDPTIARAYVNNGGDIALHLGPGQSLTTALAAATPARITLSHDEPWRGIATSGWRGRSHSLGIADSVTVLAATAARADAAATMIANAVDLPDDPRITRQPARDLAPDSDLGNRPVTTAVAGLDPASRAVALDAGAQVGRDYIDRNLIGAAYLTLQGDSQVVGHLPLLTNAPDTEHA